MLSTRNSSISGNNECAGPLKGTSQIYLFENSPDSLKPISCYFNTINKGVYFWANYVYNEGCSFKCFNSQNYFDPEICYSMSNKQQQQSQGSSSRGPSTPFSCCQPLSPLLSIHCSSLRQQMEEKFPKKRKLKKEQILTSNTYSEVNADTYK